MLAGRPSLLNLPINRGSYPPGLRALWLCNEGANTRLLNSAGTEVATFASAAWAATPSGPALGIAGSSGNAAEFAFGAPLASYSVAVLAIPGLLGISQAFFAQDYLSPNAIRFTVESSNNVSVRTWSDTGATQGISSASPSVATTDPLVAVATVNGPGLQRSVQWGFGPRTTAGVSGTPAPLVGARIGTATTGAWSGQVLAVAIWDRVISDTEARELIRRWLAGDFGAMPWPPLYRGTGGPGITPALSAAPGRLRPGAAATITLYGTGTAWTPGTPGSPTFAAPGLTIASQQVLTPTTATLSVTAPATPGAITITDPSTGAATTVGVRNQGPRWYPGLGRR